MSAPKLSVLVPCCNVEKYLRECLDSIVNQTMKDIEIICINDGSKDSTLSILQEYAGKDSRIRLIDKTNTGYGHSMNLGLDTATGEYVGIVESDDFVEPNMFAVLYRHAQAHQLDVAKGGFWHYYTAQNQNVPKVLPSGLIRRGVFSPAKDLTAPAEKTALLHMMPSIWSGIYRRDFLRDNQIRFLETPGASFQDLGFHFKVWFCANRAMVLKDRFLHYRTDNANSSVKSEKKVYCVCDEYAEAGRFLKERPQLETVFLPALVRAKFGNYLWNYERLTGEAQEAFLRRFHEEFCQHREEGTVQRAYFDWYHWNLLQKILMDPERFHQLWVLADKGEAAPDFYDAYPQARPIPNKALYFLVNRASGLVQLAREEGLAFTGNYCLQKLKEKRNKGD